jgi:hypothetical protein
MIRLKRQSTKLLFLAIVLSIAIGLLGLILWADNDLTITGITSLAATNRSVNAYFGALITAMALIITLTSNLYSPRLARVFVSHPLTILGVGYILLTNFFIIVSHLISSQHPWFQPISFISFTLTIIAMLGIIPFLYGISRFVKPSYFIPLIGIYAQENLEDLHRSDLSRMRKVKKAQNFFSLIDVINNMASTALQRKDRLVLSIVVIELFKLLKTIITYRSNLEKDQSWRRRNQFFSQGMSEEGKFYLKKDKIWPEAYILSKVLENVNILTQSDNEIVPLICREMTNSNDLAINNGDKKIIKLHLMIFNAILREALDSRNEHKFSSVIYYYRMNIELLIGNYEMCEEAISNFIHYGTCARDLDEPLAVKSFLFDMSRIINYLSFESEDLSIKLYETKLKKTWKEFLNMEGNYAKYTRMSIIKTFWNLYSQNYHMLTSKIRSDFLRDSFEHATILKEMLQNHDPLEKEYSDFLVCPEYLSGMALSLASDFLSDFIEVLEEQNDDEDDLKVS